MVPRKKVLFLGRASPDTGYDYCIQECNQRGWELIFATGDIADPTNLILSADYVFTTGYLGILESFKLGKIVLCYYNNPVKEDYLLMHPMSKYFAFDFDHIPTKHPIEPTKWAKAQTWSKLASTYEELWKK